MALLPMKCRRYLVSRGIQFEEHEEGGRKAVILKEFALPSGHFDASAADILILLPSGYPDAPPDMFYTIPWLRVASSNGYPNAADQPFDFLGSRWQRWSRHSNEWRAGTDGIWIMIKRIETALEQAT